MKTILILLTGLLLQGCLYFNDRGVSNRYYSDCKEYYDGMGTYQKECDENLLDYKTVSDGVKKGVKKGVAVTKDAAETTRNMFE